MRYKTEESNHAMERENDKRRIDELTEENYVLQMSTKSSLSESHSIRAEMQVLKDKRGKPFVSTGNENNTGRQFWSDS